MSSSTPSQPANELQLFLKALGYFRTHWWVFVLEAIVIFGFSLHNFYATPPVFESHASLLIDSTRRNLYQSVLQPGQNSGSNARRQNMANLLSGHEVFERMRNQVTDLYNSNGRPAYMRPFFKGGEAIPAEAFRHYASLGWDRNSDVYSLACSANDPDVAKDICVAYLNTVQAYYPQIGQRDSLLKHDFLRREIKSLNTQIAERETYLNEFQRTNIEMMTFVVLDLGERGMRKLHEEENNLRESMEINRALRNLYVTSRTATGAKLNSLEPTLQALNARLADLQFQLQLTYDSRDDKRDEHLALIKREIAKVTGQLSQVNDLAMRDSLEDPIPQADRRRRISELELDFRTNQVKLQHVYNEIASIQEREKRFQGKRLEYDRLIKELEHRRKLLGHLYEREQEMEVELSAGNAEIYRLEEPQRNGVRVAPTLNKFMFGALSINIFILVISLALMLALMPRLDSEAEVNRMNIPVLGKVPAIRGISLTGVEEGSIGYEYAKIINYRILRETREVKCPIIIVTSANAREGKSTISQLLCLASRSPERKTLLIDGDLLTYNHNKLFGVQEDATPGVKSVLEGRPYTDLNSLTVKTSHDGITFLPRGDRMDPSVLPTFLDPVKQMLEGLRQQYDMIFIDTPPLFQTNLAHQWAGIADLVVLVARLYYTRPQDVTEAMQGVKLFTKAPVGTCLNCVPMGSLQRRASHYYYFSRRNKKAPKLAA